MGLFSNNLQPKTKFPQTFSTLATIPEYWKKRNVQGKFLKTFNWRELFKNIKWSQNTAGTAMWQILKLLSKVKSSMFWSVPCRRLNSWQLPSVFATCGIKKKTLFFLATQRNENVHAFSNNNYSFWQNDINMQQKRLDLPSLRKNPCVHSCQSGQALLGAKNMKMKYETLVW